MENLAEAAAEIGAHTKLAAQAALVERLAVMVIPLKLELLERIVTSAQGEEAAVEAALTLVLLVAQVAQAATLEAQVVGAVLQNQAQAVQGELAVEAR